MFAYQPVRSLATLNITIQQGFSGARRVFQLLMIKMKFKIISDAKELN